MVAAAFWHRAAACLLLFAAFVASTASAGATEAKDYWVFDDEQQRQLFAELTQELACPNCLGSSLAESPAPIAEDMRREIWRQIHRGRSGDEIRQWMVQRYGGAVSTRPQGRGAALLLWILPLLLGLGALWMLWRLATAEGRATAEGGAAEDRQSGEPRA